MRIQNWLLHFFAILVFVCSSQAAELPKSKWKVMKNPARHGWSTAKIKAAFDFAKTSGSSAMMIVQDGLVVGQFGDIDKKISSYSVRKSLISALYGIYSAEGVIDITQTLEQVGIDEIRRASRRMRSKPGWWICCARDRASIIRLISRRST